MKRLVEKYLVVKSYTDVLLYGIASAITGLIIYWTRGVASAPFICFVAGIGLGLALMKRSKTKAPE